MNRTWSCVFSLLVLMSFVNPLFAQKYTLCGQVVNAVTQAPLAFVNLVMNAGPYGAVSDIDGKFELQSVVPIDSVRVSYVGFKKQTLFPSAQGVLRIALQPLVKELAEFVVVAGENPAHRIIRQVLANREANDPEQLASFSYTSYDKLVMKANEDSLAAIVSTDTSGMVLKKFLEERHLFMMETVTEKKFMHPNRSHQRVLASRVSGLTDPVFTFLMNQVMSTTFYQPRITLSNKHYINPVSPGSFGKYLFLMEDTLYSANSPDTTYLLSFRPRKGRNFDGLKGLLYINTRGYAIENVMAEPAHNDKGLGIRIQQKYALIDGKQWFPVQLNTEILFNNVLVNGVYPVGEGHSYISDIVLEPELVKREFSEVAISIDPKAADQPARYWAGWRHDTLSDKEIATYRFIDSIGQAHHFDRMAKGMMTLMNGRIPFKYVELDLRKMAHYNDYEGLYLGMGMYTGKRVSEVWQLGGYWGYGFRDKMAKYGASLRINPRMGATELLLKWSHDVVESGGWKHFPDEPDSEEKLFRDLQIQEMDRCDCQQLLFGFRPFNYVKVFAGVAHSSKQAGGLLFPEWDPVHATNTYHFSEVQLGLRYAYGETFVAGKQGRISLGSRYPRVNVFVTRGVKDFMDGDFNYLRLDAKLDASWYMRYLGKSSIQLVGGVINTALPAMNLYNGHGSYSKFSIFAPGSFGTMRMNEFLADRFIAGFYQHNFGNLLIRNRFMEPEIVLVSNLGYGQLEHTPIDLPLPAKTMEKGFFESGMVLNNLIKGAISNLGVGVLYRYGPYAYKRVQENLAFKLSLRFAF